MVTQTRERHSGVEQRLNSSLRAPCGHLPPCGCPAASGYIGNTSCCIRCPFEDCVFDSNNHNTQKSLTVLKAETVAFMYIEGVPIHHIADRLGMSPRNAYKLYSVYRSSNGN